MTMNSTNDPIYSEDYDKARKIRGDFDQISHEAQQEILKEIARER